MTAPDWIAAVSAAFLAAGAYFAYRTFNLASTEHREARDEARRRRRTDRTMDVLRELKYLTAAVEGDEGKVRAQWRRLQVTLEVFPAGELPATREVAASDDLERAAMQPLIDAASAELGAAIQKLELPGSD